jgi:excisionase family DNA binding protein
MMMQEPPRSSEEPMAEVPSVVREVIGVDEAAGFLGVDRKTVYAAASRNKIPHQRLGKRILFSRDALKVWLAGTCKGSSERTSR